MKKIILTACIISLLPLLKGNAQTPTLKNFTKGTITLVDNSSISGLVKNDIRKKASIVLIADDSGKKINYDGDQLNAVSIGNTNYLCIKGDFFQMICEGELCFLKKESDASSKPVYVGTEALFLNGTEGKPGDYFIFNKATRQLMLVNSKSINTVIQQSFGNCEAAVTKAREAGENILQLQEAVTAYNNRK